MTLDTYTHLFEEACHGAVVRAELAKSDFPNLLEVAVHPQLPAGEHLHATRAAAASEPSSTAPPLWAADTLGATLLLD